MQPDSLRPSGEKRVKDGITDLISHLIGMDFANKLGREQRSRHRCPYKRLLDYEYGD